jgi:sec-independent protein translocase protein TatA
MFGFGGQEILVILVIVLFIFGAKRLPEIGAGLGKTIKEIRKIREERKGEGEGKGKKAVQGGNLISDLKKEVEEFPGMKEVSEIRKTAGEIKKISKITQIFR